ncbi:A24 family peptidase [Yersinia enterocolitica]|uniref:Prepilin peptidase n=1 Tax=Yersinia enterocolitica TaxID=630 RepID=A0A9P1PTM9_YEREN|nr:MULTISPECIES: prepilin peptidase [Yersinia]AKF36767.1 tight adherance operon protein [Yersinia enterocolitica]ALG46632.1 tight adherance operon protein [Yersinia enterocolitica]EKN3340341.1 prepilin peptidase [Yersinia enterocolitica]EKN3342906.1 prepilin peptidase [Yersinia enterocolitica]EKN3383741.1 prepilin peptidase [Yersinia enterocolitica]
MDILNVLLNTFLILQLLFVCYSDIRHRTISNNFIITIAINTVALGLATHQAVNIIIPLSALLIGYIIFYFDLIGGGDVKLITVLLFALTTTQSLDFILYTAIMGGVVMIIGMLVNREDIKQHGVPYAVAISAGFLLSFII